MPADISSMADTTVIWMWRLAWIVSQCTQMCPSPPVHFSLPAPDGDPAHAGLLGLVHGQAHREVTHHCTQAGGGGEGGDDDDGDDDDLDDNDNNYNDEEDDYENDNDNDDDGDDDNDSKDNDGDYDYEYDGSNDDLLFPSTRAVAEVSLTILGLAFGLQILLRMSAT